MNWKNLLLIVPTILMATMPIQTQAQTPTETRTLDKYEVKIPDWSKITWDNLAPVGQPGYLNIAPELISKIGYNPTRSWSAGQKIDSIVMLGDVEDAFKMSSLSLERISLVVSIDFDKLTLNDLGLLQWQTPNTLVKAIPSLGNLDISQVRPIYDLLSQIADQKIINLTIAENPNLKIKKKKPLKIAVSGNLARIIEANPQAANTPLGKLDLSRYPMDSIPGLSKTQLARFPLWQQSFINQVPGLNKIPFDKMPQPLDADFNVIGIASLVLGASEQGDTKVARDYFISGSINRSSVTVPVACETRQECAYMELGDLVGQQGELYGKRWVSGSSQMVKGGFGILGRVNGGKEPTGRLVYGSGFKVVLTGVNESEGTADFGLFFRICANIPFSGKTCTPYFIGPVPWIPVKENELVVVGTK
ncbi:hypothetical protein [Nostoc sp. FACHB-110]|uniref:hypothetical protein n=1 Tax=Nostoc sp. FACHB-110 TaxID=2692834 RepID=UPI001686C946|nr:hypothetical protein [Nostoc sp. FACHB-110]MBD2438852.1 hypothetical protein [Nostoc sp. FACHB-110]